MKEHMNLRVGTGKFIIDSGAIDVLPSEIARLGGRAMIIGGPTTTNIITNLFPSLGLNVDNHIIRRHTSACSRRWADEYANEAHSKDCTLIIGIGGGKCIDLAKAVATVADMPIITIPTSVATCVATSAVCIMYTDAGKPDGSMQMNKEVDVCIADVDIIGTAPKRTLAAGILDSIAKYPEVIHNRTITSYKDCDIEKYICTVNGKAIYDFLFGVMDEVMSKGTKSPRFRDVILTNLLHTSVVSGFSYGTNQLAIAHGYYDFMRRQFTEEAAGYLHGELVAVGIIAQMAFNHEPPYEIEKMRKLMIDAGMPTTLKGTGFIETEENINLLLDYLIENTGLTEEHRPLLRIALRVIM